MLVLFLLFPRVQGPCGGCRPTPTAPSAGSPTTWHRGHRTGQRICRDRLPRRLRGRPAAAGRALLARPRADPLRRPGPGAPGPSRRPGPALLPEQGAAYPTLTLEPHNQHWLLALDFPARRPAILYGDDFRLLSREPVRSRLRLELVAHPATPVGLDENPRTLRKRSSCRPASTRTRALGEQLRAAAGRADDIPRWRSATSATAGWPTP